MTSAALLSPAAPLSPADLLHQQAGDAQHYRALLHELMDVGMDLVRAVREQAAAENTDPAAAREAAVTFDLLSRAVRRTVALARRVAEPLPQPRPARESAAERALGRWRSVREAEDMTQWSDSDLDAEVARVELCERLDRAELDDETGGRPVEDVVAGICRDLGLDRFLDGPPRAGRAPPDVRAPCARAAQPPAAPGSAAPASAAARRVAPQPGRRPFPPEGGTELRHEARAVQNE